MTESEHKPQEYEMHVLIAILISCIVAGAYFYLIYKKVVITKRNPIRKAIWLTFSSLFVLYGINILVIPEITALWTGHTTETDSLLAVYYDIRPLHAAICTALAVVFLLCTIHERNPDL